MPQLVPGIIFKPHRCCRRPFRVLLRDSLLRNASHPELLALPQLADHTPIPLLVLYNRQPHRLIRSWLANHQIARIHLHHLIARTSCVQRERYRAVLTVILAVAFSTRQHVVDAFTVERYEAQAVGDEFVGEDGGVGFDLNQVDSHGGDFGEDGTAQGIGEGEVNVAEVEFHTVGGNLSTMGVREDPVEWG